MKKILFFIAVMLLSHSAFAQTALDAALNEYSEGGKLTFSAKSGEKIWNQKNIAEDGTERRCPKCHTEDLTKRGKHARTGKVIEPMAPSVNKERFTKLKKIKKWIKRNCKWTIGRECTNQEKGDILTYLSQL